jgi:transcriptional regulator with XRE-family HTH domain
METQTADMVRNSGGDPVTVGARLREWRVAQDLSLSAFAEAIGLSKGKVSEMERDLFVPGVKVALVIEALSGGAIDAGELNGDVKAARHGVLSNVSGAQNHVG